MSTIFITGGSRGIGEAVVRAAAGEHNVAFTYFKNKDRALALESELRSRFGGVAAVRCDVRDPLSVREAVAEAQKKVGGISVLINNAGVSLNKLLVDVTDAEWREVMSVNLDGVFNVTRELLPRLISVQGAIVNVSSIWGEVGGSMEAAYSASKAGVIGLTRALAKEVAMMGVRVNAVAPGAIDTDMMSVYSEAEKEELISSSIPLGRLGTPSEVAEAILFLANSKYISGQVLRVDGLMS